VGRMGRSLYIIDGHAHIYAAYYAPMRGSLTSPAGEPTKAVYIFTTAMLGLIERRRPDMLVVALDSKGKTFRSDIYPQYKANRPDMPDDMPSQIERIEQILEAMRVPALRVEGFEADDIIGTLAKRASADGIEVFICSKDKDILQLLDERVRAYDIKTDTEFGISRLREEMGVSPAQFLDALALQGDSSDNVPGLPDVGPKTALSWIQQYGSIENLYAHAEQIKGKRGRSLRDFRDNVILSKKLVTIHCEVPLELDYEQLAVKQFDRARLAELFGELGFSRLSGQLGLSEPGGRGRAGADGAAASQKSGGRMKLFGAAELGSVESTEHEYHLVDTAERFAAFISQLERQQLFAVDTETTSLQPMRAELVGMSFCWKEHEAYYLPVKAPMGARRLSLEAIRPRLGSVLADERIKKVGQNIKFDLLVLRNSGMPVKGLLFDTMVASYCLDPGRKHSLDSMALEFLGYECVGITELIGRGKKRRTFDMVDTAAACRYAAEDADVTYRLYLYLRDRLDRSPEIKRLFEEVEMPLVPVLAEMEFNGVGLDTRLLRKISGELAESIKSISERIYEQAGTVFNLDSPKQLAEVLFDKLSLAPVRVGKAGRSTDADVLERLSEEHPIAASILEYRTLSKLQNTYVAKLGSLVNPRTGRVHASFNQTVTATGRLSSSGPNLQNIPIRTELGRKIRRAFVPADSSGCILSADYSQVELRLLAHFSGDAALRKAFAEDADIHAFVASQIYGVPIEQVSREMRSRCKAVNFGIIYGQGAYGLSRTVGMSVAEARRFIEDYFARYGSIREFMDSLVERARDTGYAETILGRRRKIANLSSKSAAKRSQARRLAVNTVIQGSAADLIKVAMVNIHRRIESRRLPVKMILQVHDELVFELPAAQVREHSRWIAEEMTSAIRLDVPLKVDISHGSSWLGGG